MGCRIVVIVVDITHGCDFPASGTSESNPDLYSVVENGTVVYIYDQSTGTTPALGNQVQIKDNITGNFYRYCHLLPGSISVNVGDSVNLNTKLRKNAETQEIQRVHTCTLNFLQVKPGNVEIS